MNMACVSSHRCLGSLVARTKECQIKIFKFLEEINLSRQKQSYHFYQSWNFSAKHIIYTLIRKGVGVNLASVELSMNFL